MKTIKGNIIYNCTVVYNNDILHSNYKCNYECMLIVDGYYIRNVAFKDSNYNDMVKECKELINNYITFNNPDGIMHPIYIYDHMLNYDIST